VSSPQRISPQEIRAAVQSGQALLVCAYESDAKFKDAALDGAIAYGDFQRRKASLPSDARIVFY
jgi:hypothetical protein